MRQLRKEEFSSLLANGIAMSIGGVCALLHSAIVDVWNPIPVSEIIPWAQSVIVLIIVSNLICYNLYGFLLKKFTSTFVSFIGLVTPLFASFFGWLFLNELPSVYLAISLPILALGFWFVYAEELHLGYVSKSKSSL